MSMTDAQILYALHMRDHAGKSSGQIAADLNISRSAVMGAMSRVDQAHEPCRCAKPENKDGGMPALWWITEAAA